MVDNMLSDPQYCEKCHSEIEYDGTCKCKVKEEVDIDDIMNNMTEDHNMCIIRDALEYYYD